MTALDGNLEVVIKKLDFIQAQQEKLIKKGFNISLTCIDFNLVSFIRYGLEKYIGKHFRVYGLQFQSLK